MSSAIQEEPKDFYLTVEFEQFTFEIVLNWDEGMGGNYIQSVDKAWTSTAELTLTEATNLTNDDSRIQDAIDLAIEQKYEEEINDYLIAFFGEDVEDDDQDAALEEWRERVGHRY